MIEFGPELLRVLTYDEAWLYCATLTHNNKYDWRIPTDYEFTYNDEIDEESFDQSDEPRPSHWRVQPVRTKDA
jgi:hypothetical protein